MDGKVKAIQEKIDARMEAMQEKHGKHALDDAIKEIMMRCEFDRAGVVVCDDAPGCGEVN